MTRLEQAIQWARECADYKRQQALMAKNGDDLRSFEHAQELEQEAARFELLADYASTASRAA